MFLILLALTFYRERSTPVVDRVEVNTVVQDGRCVFTQVILWRWSVQRKKFIVAEWQMLPNGYRPGFGGTIVWRNKYGTFRVKPLSMIFTRGSDPEFAERQVIAESSRIPYF